MQVAVQAEGRRLVRGDPRTVASRWRAREFGLDNFMTRSSLSINMLRIVGFSESYEYSWSISLEGKDLPSTCFFIWDSRFAALAWRRYYAIPTFKAGSHLCPKISDFLPKRMAMEYGVTVSCLRTSIFVTIFDDRRSQSISSQLLILSAVLFLGCWLACVFQVLADYAFFIESSMWFVILTFRYACATEMIFETMIRNWNACTSDTLW